MSYIGTEPSYGVFERQVLTGDGSTTSFSLDYPTFTPTQLLVSLDGVIQEPEYSYSVSTSTGQGTITFSAAPHASARIFIIYMGRQMLTPTYTTSESYVDEFSGDGSTTGFTLTRTPAANNVHNYLVFVDNVFQRFGASYAYTVIGETLTFTSAPPAGTNNIQVVQLNGVNTLNTVADGSILPAKLSAGAVTSSKLDTNIDIAGTLDVTSTLTADSNVNIAGNLTVDTNVLYVDATTNNVGVGTTSPVKKFTVSGATSGIIGTLTDGATITPDLDTADMFTVTLGGNRTLANPTNIDAGQTGSIFIVQDGTGSRTLSWGSYWDFPNGVAPTLSTGANAVDRVDFIVRSSTSIHAVFTANYS